MDNKLSIAELYDKLYAENINALQENKNLGLIASMVIIVYIVIFIIIGIIEPIAMPIMAGIIGFTCAIISSVKLFKKSKKAENNSDRLFGEHIEYERIFKEKVFKPIVEHQIPHCEFSLYNKMSEDDFIKVDVENYDYLVSSNELKVPLTIAGTTEEKTLVLYDAYTVKSGDSDSPDSIIFSGLAGYINLPKDMVFSLKVLKNEYFRGDAIKLDMDMVEFEKVFDVITDDKIKAMRILTPDVMCDLVRLVKQNKSEFEFQIDGAKMCIRFHNDCSFSTDIFSSKENQIKKITQYCDVIKMTIETVQQICDKIMEAEI